MGSSPSKAAPALKPVAPPALQAPTVPVRTAAVASVQTDDGWFDELVTGLRSVPERLRATTPPPPPEHVEERVEVIEPPPCAPSPPPPAAAAPASRSRPKSARHRLHLTSVDTGGSGTEPVLKQGAVGQKPKMPQTRAAKKRSEAKLQLQQDTLGLGQQRGPSSDDVYIYDGGSKSAFKWEDVHKEFESTLPPMSDTFSVSYVVPYDAKKNKWQQSKGGATRPRVLHNYRAFDATDDEKQWAEADKHAMHVASHQAAYVNFQHLLWALSAGQRITDECELVRVLYTWFLCVDLFKLEFKSASDTLSTSVTRIVDEFHTADYIRGETIAKLFEMFCHYLKINCRTLSGCARGGQSATGRRLRHELVTHSWNVVNVHNQWRVLDVAWGYEKLAVKEQAAAPTPAQQRLTEAHAQLAFFYFLPDPEQFACDHWCDERVWQMVEAPVSRDEFEQRAELGAGYFAFGFEGVPVLPREIDVPDAQYELSLKLAAAATGVNKPRHQAFTFKAQLQRESGLDWFDGLQLNHYVALSRKELELHCVVRPPANGEYLLTLLGCLVSKDPAAPVPPASVVARFRLLVSGADKCPRPFPASTDDEYGPQRLAVQNALWTSAGTNVGRQETPKGVVSLRLEGASVPKAISARLSRLADGESEDLSHLTEYWALDSVGANAHLPAKGEYLLELFCEDEDAQWGKGKLLWRLLVDAGAASPLALVLNEDVGVGARHIDSEQGSTPIQVDKPEQSLRFTNDKPFFICKYQLSFHPDDGAQAVDINHYSIYQSHDDNKSVTFNLRFWKKGMYSLLVHSKVEEDLEEERNHKSDQTFEKLQPSIHGCLFQYVPQAGEPPKTPSYPLGKNVMGELGLSTWGRALLELTEATRQNAVLKLQNGQYTAELSTKSPLTVWAKMWRKNKQTDELEDVSNCVLVRAIELKQQIAVYTPADGEYVLALYGDTLVDTSTSWDKHYDKDEQKQFDENTTCLLWRVVLESAGEAKQAAAVSNLPVHAFGPSASVADLLAANLRPSHLEPHQKPKEEKMELTFTVDKLDGFEKPSAQLDFVDAEGRVIELGLQGWTFITCLQGPQDASKPQNTVRVQVRFARAGFYVLSLFDAPKDIGKSRLVYSYLLEYEAAAAGELKSAVRFPRQRRDWKVGYDLLEPARGELRAEDYPSGWVLFSLRLPGVTHAAVFVERECFELDQQASGELQDVFVGEFFLAEHFQKGGKALNVAAVLDRQNAPNAYTPLLTYKLL